MSEFEKYDNPRNGIFSVLKEPNEYILPIGWIHEDKVYTIIGETDETYVTRIIKSSAGYWEANKVVQRKYINYIGLHRSRFVQWCDGQLNLF